MWRNVVRWLMKYYRDRKTYLFSGEVEVTVGQDKRRLAEKESLRFNSNLDHHFSNPGDEGAELLVILYLP